MPLPSLPEPPGLWRRLAALTRCLPAVVFLALTLLAGNGIQTLSLVVLPVSRRAFRALNRFLANLWWGWCVLLARHLLGARVVVSGDHVPMRENAIVVLNHQSMADIPLVMALARTKERLGDLKWFVKDPLKWVPGVGWGMAFLDCLFVKRDWAKDRDSIERTFRRLLTDRVPVWLVTFSEGTRLTPTKLLRSQEFATSRGLDPLRHLLLPRPRGFAAAVEGLREHVDAVYDVTIGYVDGVPSLWQYVQGFAAVTHLHVRRFPITELADDSEALKQWLIERFQEKDDLLQGFYDTGAFPEATRA